MGLKTEVQQQLIDHTNVVINCSGTSDNSYTIEESININVLGSVKLLEFA